MALYRDQWDDAYNQYQGAGQDPNAEVLGQEQAQPGGGPQGAQSQPQAGGDEAAAVDQALGSGSGSSTNSPVNADGSISTQYGQQQVQAPTQQGGMTKGTVSAAEREYYNEDSGNFEQAYDPGIYGNYTYPQSDPAPEPTAPPAPQPGITKGPTSDEGVNMTGEPIVNPTPAPPAPAPGGNGFDLNALLAALGGMGGQSNFSGFSIPAGPAAAYEAAPIQEYQAPQQSEYETAALQALLAGLNNSEWTPDRIAQQKEIQKEQALRMRGDLNREVSDRFAGMGRSGSGQQQALLRRGDNETVGQILNAYRGVDQNAAAGRRAELLSTVGALDSALSGQTGRSATGYGAYLSGAQAQAEENYRNWQSQMQMQSAALQKAIAEESAKLDWRRTDQNGLLAIAQLMENQRQFNEGMGLDWTELNLRNVR